MLWAFIDESGQPNLDTSQSNVGEYYVLSAVLVSDQNLSAVREHAERVRKKYRQTGELKSSAIDHDDSRRVQILRELAEADFTYFLVVVNKTRIDGESGLRFKRSFVKYFYGVLWGRLLRAHEHVVIRADKVGRSEYLTTFEPYVEKRKMRDLFDPREPVEFVDSKDEVLVQVADMIAGTHRLVLESKLPTELANSSLEVLTPRRAAIREWGRLGTALLESDVEHAPSPLDGAIRRTALRSAERFLHEHVEAVGNDEALAAQLEVVNIFLEHDGYGDPGTYLFAEDILRSLEGAGISITKEQLQRSIMPALRDAGVFIVSSEQGYKLPDCVTDVDRHVVRTENQVRPRLARLRELRTGLLLGTENAFDAVASEQHEFLRTLLRATER